MLDSYGSKLLRSRYRDFLHCRKKIFKLNSKKLFRIRQQNVPEDVSENITKFIVRRYDNDPSCVWAKSVKKKGDIFSLKYPEDCQPQVKSFTSLAPCSFGPKQNFPFLYFLDLRGICNDKICLYKINVPSDSTEWLELKVSKTESMRDQCFLGKRPRVSWPNLYSQLQAFTSVIYSGNFEGIFARK